MICTFEGFEIRRSLLVCTNTVHTTALPIAPAGDVLQTLVELSVLEILRAD